MTSWRTRNEHEMPAVMSQIYFPQEVVESKTELKLVFLCNHLIIYSFIYLLFLLRKNVCEKFLKLINRYTIDFSHAVLLYVSTSFITNYKSQKDYSGKMKHTNKQYKIKERNQLRGNGK